MSIAQDLSDVLEAAGQPLARLDTLAQHIPQEWIEAAALLADQASWRKKKAHNHAAYANSTDLQWPWWKTMHPRSYCATNTQRFAFGHAPT